MITLTDGAHVAIVGGGPSGSFFGIFASKLARDLGKTLDFTIYERKMFVNHGAPGCNMCAGVVSESLVQSLALEGINLPSSVVRWGIESYFFHTPNGSVRIQSSRLQQRGIATVFRGGGPAGSREKDVRSFDGFLLQKAVEHGVHVKHAIVDEIRMEGEKPGIYSDGKMLQDCDLLVGAFGIKAGTGRMCERLGVGYKIPPSVKATQSEIELGRDWVASRFGHSIHIFLLRIPGIKFVSVIPKGDYITISALGKEPGVDRIKTFLDHPVMKKMLPAGFKIPERFCHCFPKINTGTAQKPFADRLVIVGDASSSRLYKDGIGSAYITSKAAVHTTLLYGVDEEAFRDHYLPVCKTLNRDNFFGQFLFSANDIISVLPSIRRRCFAVIEWEQKDFGRKTPYSDILWDMFTGSRFYKDIFIRALSPLLTIHVLGVMIASFLKEVFFPLREKKERNSAVSEESFLGRLYNDGETIVEEGMQSRTMYVVQSGKVKVVKINAEAGGKETLLALLGEGDIFGEMSLFDASPRSATVKAVGEARVLAIEHEGLLKRIKMDPTLAFRIIKQMSQRIRELNSKLISARKTINQVNGELVQLTEMENVRTKNEETKVNRSVVQLQEKLRKLTGQFIRGDESLL